MNQTAASFIVGSGLLLSMSSLAQVSTGGQTTNAPCSPIFNGNGNTNTCLVNIPPGDRVIYLDAAHKAIALLQKMPPTSKVEVAIVGGSREINTFAANIRALFVAAHWTVLPGEIIGEMTMMGDDGVDHGEGVVCSGVTGNAAYEAAKLALKTAGHPCRKTYDQPPSPPEAASTSQPTPSPNTRRPPTPDISISIGTRIIPQD